MSVKLVERSRGNVTESCFRGDIAIVSNSELLMFDGDPTKYTYMRSCAKPIQALNVLVSGAADFYNFTEEEIAIMCASHYGEDRHREVVQSILDKIGLEKNAIKGGIVNSLSRKYADKVLYENILLDELFSDCSGKHAGKLSVCRYQKHDTENYLDKNHPIQKSILRILSDITEYPLENIEIGIDGCSAPVHALSLFNMALGYEKFANSSLSLKYQNYLDKIFNSMCSFPFMVSGTDGFCTDLIKAYKGILIGKIGAEGVYTLAVKIPIKNKLYDHGVKSLGIAVKMEDGSMEVLPVVVMEILRQLDLVDDRIKNELNKYIIFENKNDLGFVTGYTKANFKLKRM
ncbi:MAG: asparaginase [Candidatus Delongbacteria bacterium]|nr:asparaginase [Candidatus Delongbacteria bacterium]MBN2836622.1 asparaginase [Candidatus Delongbacteria bacterium]